MYYYKYNNSQLQFMNKFNKKLTINLPQEPIETIQNQSPSVPQSIQHDKYDKYDKQGLLQFRQFRDGADSEFGDAKNQGNNTKLNFVQFQEFNVYSYENVQKVGAEKMKKTPINKRNVVIQVPDRDQQRPEDRKFKQMRTTDIYLNNYEEDKFKQPPAPSKGSKFNKVFVFPTTPQKQQIKEKQVSQSKQQLKRCFQRQRQQFYKQKSRLEKEILIKNGQIEMLHKLLTQNLSASNQRSGKSSQFYHPNITNNHQLQSILLQKDLQINQLLQKISELNNLLMKKSQENSKKLIQINNAHSLIQSLRNQLYIYQRKDDNDKLTKKFYQLQAQKSKQEFDDFSLASGGKQFGSKGLQNLYKRIEMVRLNRIQFDTRNKIKSDVSYSQTTKNRTKGAFDFKGKTYDPIINPNKTKMY